MQTITSALQCLLQVKGRAIATINKGISRNWQEVIDRAARLAGVFQKSGTERGSRIACLALNSDRYFEFYLASSWAGATFVPINTRLAVPEVVYWLTDSGRT
jgi:long-chain acyl-CoA synthetase